MRLTVRQLKRIIKEAVSVEKRKQERIGALNMPPEKEEKSQDLLKIYTTLV